MKTIKDFLEIFRETSTLKRLFEILKKIHSNELIDKETMYDFINELPFPFNDNSQQDVTEFFLYLFDHLDEALVSTFQVKIHVTNTCTNCFNKSQLNEIHTLLPLSISDSKVT
jgi:uncharacterized UBP type Zn finger protein